MDIGPSASQSTANYQLSQEEVTTSSWDIENTLNRSNVKMAKTKSSVPGKLGSDGEESLPFSSKLIIPHVRLIVNYFGN